jgi:hypothetical protein
LHYKLICLNHPIDVAAYAPPGRIGLAELLSELRRTSRRASAPFIDAYNLTPAFILETAEAIRRKIEMMNPPESI